MKLFRTAFLIIIIISTSGSILSQGTEKISKVHLKDGSTLVGVIIENNDFLVRLATQSMDTLELGHKLIAGIGEKVNIRKFKALPIKIKDTGIFIAATLGLFEEGRGNFEGFRASLTIGKRLNNRLNLGFEVGSQGHTFTSNFAWGDSRFITTGAFVKYFLNTKSNRWFIDGGLGYGFGLEGEDFFDYSHDYNGGINSHLNFGRQWSLSKTTSIFFKAGIGYQHVTGDIFTNWNGPVETFYRKEFIYPSLLIGLEF